VDINKKVLLLALLKRQEDESFNDIIAQLEQTKMFSFKEGKKLLKQLKDENYIVQNHLSLKGELEAKKIEQEFKIS
jgi:formamidopyrimidine-DNA glycosylase